MQVAHGQLELHMSQHNFEFYCCMKWYRLLDCDSFLEFFPSEIIPESHETQGARVISAGITQSLESRGCCKENYILHDSRTHAWRLKSIELSSVIALSSYSFLVQSTATLCIGLLPQLSFNCSIRDKTQKLRIEIGKQYRCSRWQW